jgi:hypothetical protein
MTTGRALDLSQALRSSYRAVCSLPRLPAILVGVFTVGYFAATCDLAALRPFSFDELTTYNIATSPTVGDVLRTWRESYDGMPPVAHVATHVFGSALGFSHVTARLPSMVGFWLMCLSIFIFLSRRVGPMLALLGMLLPVTVPSAYSYAYEARGYGMVLAFSGAAMVCWDLAHGTRWRRIALIGLPISLAGAIATHLYAILVIFPPALGELARTIERRRVDWLVWLSLAAAGLVFLPAYPVISHIGGQPELANVSAGYNVSVSQLMGLWQQFLSTSATYLGVLALVCIYRDRMPTADESRERQPSPPDWVLVLGFMALPAVGWLFANLVFGLLLFRYVIAAVIGFSLVVPLLCRAFVRRRPEIALLLAGWVAVAAAGSILASRHAMRTTTVTTEHVAAGRGCFRLLNLWKRLPADGLPIVVSDFNVFHQVHHYAPEALKHRLVFLVDREFGRLVEPSMPFFAKVFRQRMEGFEEFVQSNRSFYLYDCGAPGRLPLVESLLGRGASLRDSGLVETPDILLRRELYRVSMPARSAESGNPR